MWSVAVFSSYLALLDYDGLSAGWGFTGIVDVRTSCGVGADGTVWIAGMDGAVALWSETNGWETVPGMGDVAQIAVHPDGDAWIVQGGGGIYRWDPASGWVAIYGSLPHDVGLGADGSRWIVNDTDRVYRWSDTNGWEDSHLDLPGNAKSITVDADGNPWVTMQDGAIFRWGLE
jgi:streptogramin lyase